MRRYESDEPDPNGHTEIHYKRQWKQPVCNIKDPPPSILAPELYCI